MKTIEKNWKDSFSLRLAALLNFSKATPNKAKSQGKIALNSLKIFWVSDFAFEFIIILQEGKAQIDWRNFNLFCF